MSRQSHSRHTDRGAVAIVVAMSAVMIFAAAAISVDLGNAWARTRASQTQADLAALAGGQLLPKGDSTNQAEIANLVAEYLNKNRISSDQPTVTGTELLNKTTPSHGWIEFPNDNQLRVIAPQSRVNFGVANAIGYSHRDVTTAATAELLEFSRVTSIDPVPVDPNAAVLIDRLVMRRLSSSVNPWLAGL